jgi:hypothetical protein
MTIVRHATTTDQEHPMTLPSDPNQDGFMFAGDPAEPDPATAILDEFADAEAPADDTDSSTE